MIPLLAKSYSRERYPGAPPDYALLTQHSRDVASACKALAQEVGKLTLQNAGLSEETFDSFHLQLRANGWIQDLGKVSSHFQEMVSGAPQIRQLLRHEAISGMLMFSDSLPFRKWLGEKFSDDVLLTFLWSAMGHHRKFDKLTKPELTLALTANVSHPDFHTILREMGEDLRLSSPPTLEHDLVISQTPRDKCDIGAREALRDLQDEFVDAEELFIADSARRRLALVKGLGIGADVAASAIAFRGQSATKYSVRDFVLESLRVGLTSLDLQKIITHWAWNESATERSNDDEGKMPTDVQARPFQIEIANAKGHLTFAQAGCGSGKSLAAYMWAQQWCQRIASDGRNNFRLFVCLPTTGTTTEHFKDYALESGIDPNLMSLTHSRSSIDLRAIAETAPQEESTDEEGGPASAAQDALNAEKDKIQSLALWSTPLVVTTTDTVLGLMVNARRSIYSLPALMCGAFVFDEIHAFDDQLFGHLLVFLKNFPKLPVLLMTASLPKQRLDALKRVRPEVDCVPGPPEFEELKRYVIREVSDPTEVLDEVKGCLVDRGKVLWVRNRVEWANHTYAICRKDFSEVFVNIYHSRLKYKHRSQRHRQVIDVFKRSENAAILVSTQVAEMSLDLSADLLITDLAPIPSLIQRMGRLNRRLTPDTPEKERSAKPALICPLPPGEPRVELPYDTLQLETAKKWMAALLERNEPLNQRDLSEVSGQFSEEKEFDFNKAEQLACFFSGLWETRPGSTRGEGHTISVILEEDKDEWERTHPNASPTSDWLREHEVSIPIRDEALRWERLAGLRIAPRDAVVYDYDESTHEGTGARCQRK
jgi:CRISPR-associated endonuclease/helicase Cas3